MSEGGGEALGPSYTTSGGYHSSQPPTPSSTVPDAAADAGGTDQNSKSSSSSGLPPFSSFSATELAAEGLGSRLGPEGFGTETYAGRLLDFPGWSYYEEGLSGRLLDRGEGLPMLIPQPQYRPWESKPMETSQDGFTKYDYPGSPASKLPSFQSQFNAFNPEQNGETISLTTLTPAPPSPTANNSGLPSFHTLSTVTVNPRGYPLVPAPVQAREIPTIQQQFLDERHIHLFQSPTTLNNAQYHQLGLTPSNPGIIQGNFVTHPQPPQQTTLLTVVKTEPVAIVTTNQLHQQPHIYQNSNTILDPESIKIEENISSPRGMQDSRKKERRKMRASSMSMDNSIESDGVGSSSVESSGQVAAISSTASFKSPLMQHQNIGSLSDVNMSGHHGEGEECENGTGEKQTKKKRKRCGECIGCQRKDNCGDCAPCRNDKSHQICKMRRCEKLTDKKHLLYLTNEFPRTESRRGRGKGTRTSYRSKGRGGGNSNQNQGPPTPQQNSASTRTVTPQPSAHPQTGSTIVTLNGNDPSPNPTMSADQSSGSVLPFYGSNIPAGNVTEAVPGFPQTVREHRFPNAVWQQISVPTDTTSMGTWPPQGQFIQQLAPPQLDELRYHTQYPAAAPVTVSSYNQPSPGYQPAQNNFLQINGPPYQSQPPAVSPLMNGSNTSRSNSVNGTIDYVDASPRPTEYINGAYPGQESLVPQPSSTPNSRCSSVQNMDSNTNDSVGSIASSKTPTNTNRYIQPIGTAQQVTNQGNGMPGYPPQQPPQSQQSLHNSSGYPGQNSQSVTHRYIGEDIKQPIHNNVKDHPIGIDHEINNATKDWVTASQESAQNVACTDHQTNTWATVNMSSEEKHNNDSSTVTAVYQTNELGGGTYRNDDHSNVNNKLKTMILNKQQQQQHTNQNQNHYGQPNQNFHHQSQDSGSGGSGQFAQQHHQNKQFCSPTPPPMSPVHSQQTQHLVSQNSPSQNLQLSSQHFQYNNQNRSVQQAPMQPQQNQSQQAELHQRQQQQYQQQIQQQMHEQQKQQQFQFQQMQEQQQMKQLHQQQQHLHQEQQQQHNYQR